jgi:hypothetical protein
VNERGSERTKKAECEREYKRGKERNKEVRVK